MRCASPPESVSAERVEREVVEPDVVQEAEPVGDLAQRSSPRSPAGCRRAAALEEGLRVLERAAPRLPGSMRPATRTWRASAPQPRAVAVRAGAVVQVLGELLPHRGGIGLAVAALEVRQDALEGVLAHGATCRARRGSGRRSSPRPSRRSITACARSGSFSNGRLDVEAVVLRERLQHREVELVAPVPAADRARRRATGAGRRRRASGRRT